MYCIKCGTQQDDDAEFCTNCGVRLTGAQAAAKQNAPAPVAKQKGQGPADGESAPKSIWPAASNGQAGYAQMAGSAWPAGNTQTAEPARKGKLWLYAGVSLAALALLGVVLMTVIGLPQKRQEVSAPTSTEGQEKAMEDQAAAGQESAAVLADAGEERQDAGVDENLNRQPSEAVGQQPSKTANQQLSETANQQPSETVQKPQETLNK